MGEQKYPEPTVGALIFDEEDKVFLMTSPKWPGKYVIPGGHIELGETAEQALKREVKEETNLDVYNVQFIALQEFIFGKEFHKKRHFIFLEYACKAKNTDVALSEEGGEYVWASLDEALKLPLASYTRTTILKYKKGRLR